MAPCPTSCATPVTAEWLRLRRYGNAGRIGEMAEIGDQPVRNIDGGAGDGAQPRCERDRRLRYAIARNQRIALRVAEGMLSRLKIARPPPLSPMVPVT